MNLEEKCVSSKEIYDGKIMKVRVDEVTLPDGKKSHREYIRHTGGCAVLLIIDGKVALVKQYRYVYGKPIYEIPAGKLEKGEPPEVGAKRECEEETGYSAELKHLVDIYPSPGYTDEIIHIYVATSAKFVGQRVDDGEFLTCEFISLDRVIKMIESGEICDAKTVVSIYKYLSTKQI